MLFFKSKTYLCRESFYFKRFCFNFSPQVTDENSAKTSALTNVYLLQNHHKQIQCNMAGVQAFLSTNTETDLMFQSKVSDLTSSMFRHLQSSHVSVFTASQLSGTCLKVAVLHWNHVSGFWLLLKVQNLQNYKEQEQGSK